MHVYAVDFYTRLCLLVDVKAVLCMEEYREDRKLCKKVLAIPSNMAPAELDANIIKFMQSVAAEKGMDRNTILKSSWSDFAPTMASVADQPMIKKLVLEEERELGGKNNVRVPGILNREQEHLFEKEKNLRLMLIAFVFPTVGKAINDTSNAVIPANSLILSLRHDMIRQASL